MTDGLLSGFRALDLTDQKGFVCGKILAAMGVETIKVERPGGDPARLIPPFLHNERHPEKSLYWLAFNTDKRVLPLTSINPKDRSFSGSLWRMWTLCLNLMHQVIWIASGLDMRPSGR